MGTKLKGVEEFEDVVRLDNGTVSTKDKSHSILNMEKQGRKLNIIIPVVAGYLRMYSIDSKCDHPIQNIVG